MNQELKDAMHKLIAYVDHDERKDFESRQPGDCDGHIWVSIERVKAYLDETGT